MPLSTHFFASPLAYQNIEVSKVRSFLTLVEKLKLPVPSAWIGVEGHSGTLAFDELEMNNISEDVPIMVFLRWNNRDALYAAEVINSLDDKSNWQKYSLLLYRAFPHIAQQGDIAVLAYYVQRFNLFDSLLTPLNKIFKS